VTPRRRPGFLLRRRGGPVAPEHVERSYPSFRRCLELVEGAKEALAGAAPGGRVMGVPVAEALASFEDGLHEAAAIMASWRTSEVEEAWNRCEAAIRESLRRAEALRLGPAPSGYEQLYTVLSDLMEPLEAFASALDRFHDLGV
jgi:hypothetical protein